MDPSQQPLPTPDLHPLIARLLARRGYSDADALHRHLTPRLADLTQPDAMVDRDVAADRLAHAARRRERVVVFGDYDVDGITSAALLTRVLRTLGAEVIPLTASRFEGGYGLSEVAAARVLENSPGLLVTCDCGTSDHARLETIRARGIDAIVVDHHKVPAEALPVMAFLNPHRPDCGFPYKGLASVGLAFSIAAALRARSDATMDVRPLLDIVALGTIADVAPLDGDNRILVRAGFERMSTGVASAGVRALIRLNRLRYGVSSRDVSYAIAPMLNAPGRLGSARPTLDLLLTDNDAHAIRLAAELSDANTRRKAISAELITAALKQVHEVYGNTLPAGIVVAGDAWHGGMGGIVAGRLVDRLGVAAVVIALEGDVGVGSVRAPRGTKLYDALVACRGDLESFGGHDAAAGVRMRRDRIEAFRAGFAAALASAGPVASGAHEIDAELVEEDLMPALARDLLRLEPTGEGNREPMVSMPRARVRETRVVGETHLRVTLALGRRTLGAFVRDGSARAGAQEPAVGSDVAVIGRLRTDPYAGPAAVQVEVKSLRPADIETP